MQPLVLFSQNPVPKAFQRSWNRHQIQAELILRDSQIIRGNILTTNPEELVIWTAHQPPAWEWNPDSVVRLRPEDIHQLNFFRQARWMQSSLEMGGATIAATNLQLWRWATDEPYYDGGGPGAVITLAGLTSIPLIAIRTRVNQELVIGGQSNVWEAAQPLLQQTTIATSTPHRFRIDMEEKELPPFQQVSSSKIEDSKPPLQVWDFGPTRWHIGYVNMFTKVDLKDILITYFGAYSSFGYHDPQAYVGHGLEAGYQFRPRWRAEGTFFRMGLSSLGGPNDAQTFSDWWEEPQPGPLLNWQASLRLHHGYVGLSWLPRARFMRNPYRWEPFLSFGASFGATVFEATAQGELITQELERFPLEPLDRRDILWALGGYFRMGTDFYLKRWCSLRLAGRISQGPKIELPAVSMPAIGSAESAAIAARSIRLFPIQLEGGIIFHL
ncbi:MAG: hypothetical protein AAF399_11835 [Bacteroidota bacterium]